MRRRQTMLGIMALSLAIANLVAMPHTLAALSEFSGGASLSPVMSSSGGCGCSQPKMEVSPETVKQALSLNDVAQGEGVPKYETMQRRHRGSTEIEVGLGVEVSPGNPSRPRSRPDCDLLREVCTDLGAESRTQETVQTWCEPRNPWGPRCMDAFPDYEREPHYKRERTRTKYICRNGDRTVIWVSCGPWRTVNCCDNSQTEPTCLGGADRECDP